MGFEAQKTNRIRGEKFLQTYFSGRVLDIGCGPDLVTPTAQPFDREHGDANHILDYLPPQTFDCVHSSHCLEHMEDVRNALAQWWTLVKPGGHLVLVVPDEDLYEQGYWPSIFNNDHKASFRLDKKNSWSPVSYELRELLSNLPNAEIIEIKIQDNEYDYALLRILPGPFGRFLRLLGKGTLWLHYKRRSLFQRFGLGKTGIDRVFNKIERFLGMPIAQTDGQAVAQIQAVIRKI
ncbi:methyltransferase domain-containing protein [Telmatospirillum siberiense]|uniref:SAM-dependent methyltransferase n=1 Tax=Telmatospirillum siberiense TaxID=382514 RepID=A0A2N3PVN9_9PROT|nr:class I SAM-dependent methyltransferase [Telmatospirillum siberiense]PKU24455.1 hypothetical protein CWS72_11445 [Telmatospirillum siberiense]